MEKITLTDVLSFIYNQSTPTDRQAIAEAFKTVRKNSTRQARAMFDVGDPVEFSDKRGMAVRGKITKINRVTIHVTATSGARWRVAPPLLRKV